jgi:hypothetical protein
MSNSSPRLERISRAAAREAGRDADDLESAALRAGISVKIPLDESIYDLEISEGEREDDGDETDDQDPVAEVIESDATKEQLVGAAVNVVQQRIDLLGEIYPFQLSETGLEYIGSRTLAYELCLAIVNVNVSVNPYKQLQVAFERLAGVAMSLVLGPGAESLRTGYPPQNDAGGAGQPRSFANAIEMLNEKMRDEWISDLNTRLEDPKDGGVDSVVWKRIDKRTGSLVYVGNCWCGRNWFNEKKHWERSSDQLGLLLSRPKPYLMNDFFCLPFHISEKREWEEACDQGRFVLDRVRLALTAELAGGEWVARGQTIETMRELIGVADSDFKPETRQAPS